MSSAGEAGGGVKGTSGGMKAILLGLSVALISPLASVGGYACSQRDSLFVLGAAFFVIAVLASFPGFFLGWLLVHGVHLDNFLVDFGAVYLCNWLVYSLISYLWKFRAREGSHLA